MPAEGTRGDGDKVQTLQEEIDQLKKALDAERSKGFWGRLFGRYRTEDQDKARERVRGQLARRLVLLLAFVLVATYVYIIALTFYFSIELNPDDLTTLVPMVGTTLLTPLIGLIGAVTGFYFGGLTATQAANQSHEAHKETTQQALDQAPSDQTIAHVTEATQAAAQAAQAAARAADR